MEAIKTFMSEYHLESILDECAERNMTLEEYLVMYLLTKQSNKFWDHMNNLLLKHRFGCSDESLELDPEIRN